MRNMRMLSFLCNDITWCDTNIWYEWIVHASSTFFQNLIANNITILYDQNILLSVANQLTLKRVDWVRLYLVEVPPRIRELSQAFSYLPNALTVCMNSRHNMHQCAWLNVLNHISTNIEGYADAKHNNSMRVLHTYIVWWMNTKLILWVNKSWSASVARLSTMSHMCHPSRNTYHHKLWLRMFSNSA